MVPCEDFKIICTFKNLLSSNITIAAQKWASFFGSALKRPNKIMMKFTQSIKQKQKIIKNSTQTNCSNTIPSSFSSLKSPVGVELITKIKTKN